jgi:hypothetical protein
MKRSGTRTSHASSGCSTRSFLTRLAVMPSTKCPGSRRKSVGRSTRHRGPTLAARGSRRTRTSREELKRRRSSTGTRVPRCKMDAKQQMPPLPARFPRSSALTTMQTARSTASSTALIQILIQMPSSKAFCSSFRVTKNSPSSSSASCPTMTRTTRRALKGNTGSFGTNCNCWRHRMRRR